MHNEARVHGAALQTEDKPQNDGFDQASRGSAGRARAGDERPAPVTLRSLDFARSE